MEWNGMEIEAAVQEELATLITLLKAKEEIVCYQKAERSVEENVWIQEMVDKIKQKQKELVNFEYYEKPQAYQKVKQELDHLNNELENSLSVHAYRDALWEANEIVQLLFQRLQAAVEEETGSNSEKQ